MPAITSVLPSISMPDNNSGWNLKTVSKRPKSRKVRLKRIMDVKATNKRVIKLIQLADEGRKRSNVLPPLDTESSFYRTPRKGGSLHNLNDELADGALQRKYKKISIDLDRKIVNHLRRKLSRRIEQRYNESDEENQDAEYFLKQAQLKSQKTGKSSEKRNIFSKYSDIGEIITDNSKSQGRRSSSIPKSEKLEIEHVPNGEIEQVPKQREEKNEVVPPNASEPEVKTEQLQDNTDPTQEDADEQIGKDGAPTVLHSAQKKKSVCVTEVPVEQMSATETGESVDEDEEVFKLTQRKNTEVPIEKKVDFRLLDISPVTTPVVYRPETRENTTLSSGTMMNRVLQGYNYRRCHPESKMIQIYVCSEFVGTEVERTHLMEKVYPKIRRYCLEKGYDFRAIDLHWSLQDDVIDDHRLPKLCQQVIGDCQSDSTAIDFLILCGEKYGTYVLPPEIPKDEFEEIYNTAKAFYDEEMQFIRDKLIAIDSNQDVNLDAKTEASSENTNSETAATDDKPKIRGRKSVIRKETIRDLKAREEALPDVKALEQWYILDENSVPPVYRLQNISSFYKEILNKDTAKRTQARQNYGSVMKKLLKILQEYAPKVLDDPEDRRKYFISLFEMELEHGLETDNSSPHCLLIQRTIRNVKNNLDDVTSAKYLDVTHPRSQQMDKSREERIEHLRETVLPMKVPESYRTEFKIEWYGGGINPQTKREHSAYVDRMCKAVLDTLKRDIGTALDDEGSMSNEQVKLYEEVSQHVAQCHHRSRNFHGRKELLQTIKAYMRSPTKLPLVVHGKSGTGKSALLAKATKEIYKWFKGTDIRVIYRQIATTMASTNIRTLLRSICLQMCEIFDDNSCDIPSDFKGIVNDFGYRMQQATKQKPLVIVLDALDMLSDAHDGRKLIWLPKDVPDHVHIIVSTLPDDKYLCYPILKKQYEGSENCLLGISDMPENDAITILHHWLNSHNRALTDEQYEVLLNAFEKCPTPLYLKCAFNESLSWTSYTNPEMVKLSETVKKIATIKFGRLERDHGEALVKRALGYITASRSGITDLEMEDLLSMDDVVMDEVYAFHKPCSRRLPQFKWESLKVDLDDYLLKRSADNTTTLCWAHVDFCEAAQERYLNQRDKAPSYHKALAEYFRGIWVDKPKPYAGNDKGADRLLSPQPLYFEPENPNPSGSDRVYNLRKLNELPYHLLSSQQNSLLKSETLCNFEWILAKLCGTSLTALLEEYQFAHSVDEKDFDFKALSDALHLSSNALLCEPKQLASQLIGRLHGILSKDVPATAGDPRKYPFLHNLVAQAENSSLPALIPSHGCLTEPGGILFDLLSGHTEPITAVTLTNDGFKAVTSSKDGTMKLWDLRSGKVVKTIENVGHHVSRIRLAMNNTYAITSEDNVIKIWSITTGANIHTISEYVDPAVTITASDSCTLVACFYGSNMIRTWDLGTLTFTGEERIPGSCIHKDRSILAADNSPTDKVLVAFRSANTALVIGARSKKVLQKLVCNEESSSIVALAITSEYFVVGCRQQYMKLHEIYQLELFDAKKGYYIRSVRGCTHDQLSELHLNLHGSHAIAVCTSERNNTSDIALWNLETEDHKHLATHARLSTIGACCDFRFCLTAAKDDNTLRIWNLSKQVNQHAPKLKKALGVGQIFPMKEYPRYVVAKAVNHGPISVWNVAKAKCLQTAVRIERGMTETSDVVIALNSQLVILTDRGFSNATDDSKPVFQTVLIYNLKTKRYERKLTSCYIVPAPSHEYVLLDENHLMGPSDNRTHFVVWSLQTGQVTYRIRTDFKEKVAKTKMAKGLALLGIGGNKKKRASDLSMTPWDLRAESDADRERRHQKEKEQERNRLAELKKEKENSMEQFIVSGNQKKIVASFFAHHLCVFDIPSQTHTQVIENEHSMMFLHVAALTYDGDHLVHANYDEESKISYVTLWDLTTGEVKRRLKNESDVCSIGITDNANRVVIGKSPNELHIWDPMSPNSLKKIKGYSGLKFSMGSKIFITEEGRRAIVLAGDISVWDIENVSVMAVFTPDTKIMCCELAYHDSLITFGLYERSEVIILKLMCKGQPVNKVEDSKDEDLGANVFGEKIESSDEEDDEDEG
ncbi:hypothetical protein LOTGIDRAFT_236714 [Lottia gigantea]|uniref:Uncharacterized protein n=1 Tax=Lottia gigantea TaxID=225164 RepID=V3ZQU4_LOTGI|nr:hypothetical protein LOTGIDRAFT_236714 [Lottia gigantea]ESO83266.1 hypothetical protein LOTGIDRAFT_236714 [Lottia gigantea]